MKRHQKYVRNIVCSRLGLTFSNSPKDCLPSGEKEANYRFLTYSSCPRVSIKKANCILTGIVSCSSWRSTTVDSQTVKQLLGNWQGNDKSSRWREVKHCPQMALKSVCSARRLRFLDSRLPAAGAFLLLIAIMTRQEQWPLLINIKAPSLINLATCQACAHCRLCTPATFNNIIDHWRDKSMFKIVRHKQSHSVKWTTTIEPCSLSLLKSGRRWLSMSTGQHWWISAHPKRAIKFKLN